MQLPLNRLVLDVQLLRVDGDENEEERKGPGLLNPLKVTLGRGGGHCNKGKRWYENGHSLFDCRP